MFKIQNVLFLVLTLTGLLGMVSCSPAGPGGSEGESPSTGGTDDTVKTGIISFDASAVQGDIDALVVSIKDGNGNSVIASVRIALDDMKQCSLTLPAGTYRITKYLLVDADDKILHAAPGRGSEKAEGVDEAKILPIEITIEDGKTADAEPEAVVSSGEDAAEFGLLPIDFEVVDPLEPDTFAPFVRSITITPGRIEDEGTIIIQIDAEDIGSGIDTIDALLLGPTSLAERSAGNHQWISVDEENFHFDRLTGKWRAEVDFTRYNESGTWCLDLISLKDIEGNRRMIEIPGIDSTSDTYIEYLSDKDTGITLASGQVEFSSEYSDVTAPILRSIDTGSGIVENPGRAAFDFRVFDRESGIDMEKTEIILYNKADHTKEITLTGLVYNSNIETITGYADFTASHPAGMWQVGLIFFQDRAGNRRLYSLPGNQADTEYNCYPDPGAVFQDIPLGDGEVEYVFVTPDTTAPALNAVIVPSEQVFLPCDLTLSFDITEEESGLQEAYVQVYSPKYLNGNITGTAFRGDLEFNEETGLYDFVMSLDAAQEVGNWKVYRITLLDNAGNETDYYRANPGDIYFTDYNRSVLTGFEIPVISVTDAYGGDRTAPVVTAITASHSEIFAPGTLTLALAITEEGSGLAGGMVTISDSSHLAGTGGSSIGGMITLNPLTNLYELTLIIDEQFETGEWKVEEIEVADNAGNENRYVLRNANDTYLTHSASNIYTNLRAPVITITEAAGEDTTAPVLESITFSSTELNTPGTVTLSLDIIEEGSGLERGYVKISGPALLGGNGAGAYIEGEVHFNPLTNRYEMPVSFEDGFETGTWKVSGVFLDDRNNNDTDYMYDTDRSTAYFYDIPGSRVTGIAVPELTFTYSSGGNNTTAPDINSISFNTAGIEAPGEAVLSLDIQEFGSGFQEGWVKISSPKRLVDNDTGEGAYINKALIYNNVTGLYEAHFSFTDYHQYGTWKVTYIGLRDFDSNNRTYGFNSSISQTHFYEATSMDLSTFTVPELLVISSAEDTEPARINEANADCITISNSGFVSAAGGPAAIYFDIVENASGVSGGYARVVCTDPLDGEQPGDFIEAELDFDSSTGRWYAVFHFQGDHDNGTWKLTNVSLVDNADNPANYFYNDYGNHDFLYNSLTGALTGIETPVIIKE